MTETIYNGQPENTDPGVYRTAMPATYKASGAVIVPYTIMGRLTTTGELVVYNSGGSDGSEIPVRISPPVTNQDGTDSINTVTNDVQNMAWATGCFNPELSPNYTAAVALLLEPKGIFFKEAK